MSGSVYTRQQYWGGFEPKEAEVGDIMPNASLPSAGKDKGAKSVIPKTGSAVGLPEGVEEDAVKGEQPEANPQAKPINPRVSVEGKEPPKLIEEKTAQHFAMPSLQRYPLDSYLQVKQAAAYFEEYRGQFAPVHRREFCSNLVKRASVLGIEVSDVAQSYGGSGYASHAELEVSLASRRSLLSDESHVDVLDKLAEARVTMGADEFALTLSEFDKMAGIEQHYDCEIPDPYLCIFGKTAAEEDDASFVIGNDIVSACQLQHLADSPCISLQQRFGEDFVKGFRKDPVGIFKSLPVDQKKILSREANEPTLTR